MVQATLLMNMIWQILSFGFTIIIYPKIGGISRAYGIYIHSAPKNTSAVVGSSVTFTCGVLDQRSGDSVFWKKVSEGEYAEVVSYNDWSLNSSKHDVFVKYTQSAEIEYLLEIHDVNMNDEVMYECQAGGDRARAILTVTVPPYNMTLEWDPTPPFILNSMVNLTCGAFHSRPPAEIIWLHGVKDLSDWADTYETFYNNSDGYGEVISVLTVDVDLNKAGSRYRCIARVPGQKREEAPSMSSYFLITGLSSDGATLQSDTYHLCLLWLVVIKVFSSRMLI